MIQVAIQAARFAPYAKAALATAAPWVKPICIGVGIGVALNETGRIIIKQNNKRAEKAFDEDNNITTIKPEQSWFRRVVNMEPGETYGASVKRRSLALFDIVCYAGGTAFELLNFCTVKLLKLVGWVAGSALYCVFAGIPAGVVWAWTAATKKGDRKKMLKTIDRWVSAFAFSAFRAFRWVDRQAELLAHKMMRRRGAFSLPIYRYDPELRAVVDFKTGQPVRGSWTASPYFKAQPEVTVTEITVDEVIPTMAGIVEEELANGEVIEDGEVKQADLDELIDMLNAQTAVAKADPKAYGAMLFAEALSKNLDLADRRKKLPADLRALGLTGKNVTLAIQGYDEAAKAASSNVG